MTVTDLKSTLVVSRGQCMMCWPAKPPHPGGGQTEIGRVPFDEPSQAIKREVTISINQEKKAFL